MSPKVPVFSLNYICVKFVSNLLVQSLSDEGLNYTASDRCCLDVTYEVLQDILKNILNSTRIDAATRFNCLQVLFREDLQKLDTGIFPHSYYEKILKVITRKGRYLQQLNLKGVWARDHPQLLSELVRSLHNLKVLIMPHMADDTVLASLSHCKNLVVLDVSGESCFTATGLAKLKSDTLEVLEIGTFGKKAICEGDDNNFELLSELIRNLPNLKSLRTYSFAGSVLVRLSLKNFNKCTKLTYLHDTGTTKENFDAIMNLCPNLDSIYMDTPEQGVIRKLTLINKLHCLKLSRPWCDELLHYLSNCGDNIEILKLNSNKNVTLDLSEICAYTTNLHTLECYHMKLCYYSMDIYFMSLQNVELLYCTIADSTVLILLTNSPFLKRAIIGSVMSLTDGDIFRLCADCDFLMLEELWFSCARGLTAISLELLMNHCPKLKTIGQVTGWDVSSEELQYLRSLIREANIDLTILPILS